MHKPLHPPQSAFHAVWHEADKTQLFFIFRTENLILSYPRAMRMSFLPSSCLKHLESCSYHQWTFQQWGKCLLDKASPFPPSSLLRAGSVLTWSKQLQLSSPRAVAESHTQPASPPRNLGLQRREKAKKNSIYLQMNPTHWIEPSVLGLHHCCRQLFLFYKTPAVCHQRRLKMS